MYTLEHEIVLGKYIYNNVKYNIFFFRMKYNNIHNYWYNYFNIGVMLTSAFRVMVNNLF